jgi:hypothetical protein
VPANVQALFFTPNLENGTNLRACRKWFFSSVLVVGLDALTLDLIV